MIELLVDAALAELEDARTRLGAESCYPGAAGRSFFARLAGGFRSEDPLDAAEQSLLARRALQSI